MVEGSFGILELGELWNDENKFDDLGEVSFGILELELDEVSVGMLKLS